MRILAYDHGSKAAGWGVIEVGNHPHRPIAYGQFYYDSWPNTLLEANRDFARILEAYKPDVVLFYNQASMRNAVTARKLLQVQGAVMLACLISGATYVDEIRDVTVKRIVGGSGKATKAQVKKVAAGILGITAKLTEDTGDALGLALAYPTWKTEQEAKADGDGSPGRRTGAASNRRGRGSRPVGAVG